MNDLRIGLVGARGHVGAELIRLIAAHPHFETLSCDEVLAAQRIQLRTGERLRLWPHQHGTDGFFAAAFVRRH